MSLEVYLRMEIDTGGKLPHLVTLFEASVWDDLGKMAEEAGIGDLLWRPGETKAGEMIEPLRAGLDLLTSDPARFKRFKPEWGTYANLVGFVRDYLAACEKHPKATIEACG